jgi:ubiquinol-cytochrome c reductase iron-sulfur subunit
MARQAGLDRAPHARAARRALPKVDAQLADPKSERKAYEPTPSTPRTKAARSSPNRWSPSASARTWAARLPTSSSRPAAFAAGRLAGGFLCPCHGSTFDLAGRVYKNKPAPDNLEVPPHMYLSDTRLLMKTA